MGQTKQAKRGHNIGLDWCLTWGHLPPADLRTARAVLESILPQARASAFTPEEIKACDDAERNCTQALNRAVVIA